MYAANISLMFSRDVYSYTTVYISILSSLFIQSTVHIYQICYIIDTQLIILIKSFVWPIIAMGNIPVIKRKRHNVHWLFIMYFTQIEPGRELMAPISIWFKVLLLHYTHFDKIILIL